MLAKVPYSEAGNITKAGTDYKGRYLHSPGREGLPLHLEPLSPENESSLIKTLIRELNENLVLNLDTNPNFSRSAKRPEMHYAP